MSASAINPEPHVVIQFSEDEEEWIDYRDYHINADYASMNDHYLGAQISLMLSNVHDSPQLSWRIVYREATYINTTAGVIPTGRTEHPVTDVNKFNVHVEEFFDRNGDGYYELNQGMPVYQHAPRFYTEHDQVEGAPSHVIKAGDVVRVADPAYCFEGGSDIDGYVDDSFYGALCKVIGADAYGNLRVEHLDESDSNVIHPTYLTKVNKDGSAVEEPEPEAKDEEFKAGEEVKGEDEPDDTIHVSDGDVITIYDEFGHEKTMRISVV